MMKLKRNNQKNNTKYKEENIETLNKMMGRTKESIKSSLNSIEVLKENMNLFSKIEYKIDQLKKEINNINKEKIWGVKNLLSFEEKKLAKMEIEPKNNDLQKLIKYLQENFPYKGVLENYLFYLNSTRRYIPHKLSEVLYNQIEEKKKQ